MLRSIFIYGLFCSVIGLGEAGSTRDALDRLEKKVELHRIETEAVIQVGVFLFILLDGAACSTMQRHVSDRLGLLFGIRRHVRCSIESEAIIRNGGSCSVLKVRNLNVLTSSGSVPP